MKGFKRLWAAILAAMFLFSVIPISVSCGETARDGWEEANLQEAYEALSMWLRERVGSLWLFDRDDEPIDLDEDMRMAGGTILATEAESMAVVDMDRERLAIMDEISRAGFDQTEQGDRIRITLMDGAMYFRVGQPLEEKESFEIVMDDIVLAIRGTCGMVQQSENGISMILASGHAVITHIPEEDNGEPAEITIEAGECVSAVKEEADGEIRFDQKKLTESEVPEFLVKALRRDPSQLDKVFVETGWQPEELFGRDIPVWSSSVRELYALPEELVGKTLGCGGWFNIVDTVRFPSETEMTTLQISSGQEYRHRLRFIRQYSEHFYGLCYRVSNGWSEEKIILPGITDEEVRQLQNDSGLAFLSDRWEEIQGKNQYAIFQSSRNNDGGMIGIKYYDDITDVGADNAQPFVDYEPCGYVFSDRQVVDAIPDALIGTTLYREYTIETEKWPFMITCEFTSGSTFEIIDWYHTGTNGEMTYPQITVRGTITGGSRSSDHVYSFEYASEDILVNALCRLNLIMPGMSDRELQFFKECGGDPSLVEAAGNNQYVLTITPPFYGLGTQQGAFLYGER